MACGSGSESVNVNANVQAPTVDVTTAQAIVRQIPTYFEATGNLAGDAQTDVAPAVGGKVVEINFDVGSYVNKGDVLLRLDDRDARIRVEQAEAQVQQQQRAVDQSIANLRQAHVRLPDPTLIEATELALANRPELEINRTQRDINLLDQRLYRDQKKPQIDLIAGYSANGVGGNQNPNFNPTFPTACTVNPTSPACRQQQANLATLTGSPFTDILANRYPTYRVGVNFNIPLFGDKTASAQLGRSQVEGERIVTQREQIEQAIEVDVRNAIQTIRVRSAQLRSAAIARENSERQYESEQRKLDEGQSDTFRVLERQTALAIARSNELRARTELNKAIAELERATGNTLKANDIDIK